MRISRFLAIAIGAVATLSATDADARLVTPQQALERALPKVKKIAPGKNVSSPVLMRTIECQGAPAVYVMASKTSTLFLSADDMAPALLGYTDGLADSGNLPPALMEWLDDIGQQIALASAEEEELVSGMRAPEDARAVAPLIKTKWNQGEPYDRHTPLISGKKSPTGCAATALAQLVNYHRYPARPKGSITYFTNVDNGTADYTFDFDAEPDFDYMNMRNSYNGGNYSDAEAEAVSRLMISCGRASKMLYHWSQSATTIADVTYGMVKYLQYDPNIHLAFRRAYDLAEWQGLLENELLSNRPILFAGNNAGSGHCFLLDGFNEEGYFHVNWGWAGTSDGYFYINGLTPKIQGTGGSDSGYNMYQIAALNVKPLEEGSYSHLEAPSLLLSDWGPTPGSYERSKKLVMMRWLSNNYSGENGWMNIASCDFSKQLGIKFVNEAGEEYFYFDKLAEEDKWGPQSYYSSYVVFPCTNDYGTGIDIPNGSYKAYPVCRSGEEYGGVITDADVSIGNRKYVNVTVTDANILVSYPADYVPSLGSDRPVMESPLYPGKPARIRINFKNYGPEYYNNITLSLKESYFSSSSTRLGSVFVNIPEGGEAEYEWVGTVPANVATGGYYLMFSDFKGQSFGAMTWVEVEEVPTDDSTVSISDFTFHNRLSGSGVNYDPHTLNGNVVDFSFNLNCHSGYFTNPIYCRIREGMTDVKNVILPNHYVKNGSYVNVNGSVALDDLEYDHVYAFNVMQTITYPSGYRKNEQIMPASSYFRMQDINTGVDAPKVDAMTAVFEGSQLIVESNMPMHNVSLYDAMGRMVFSVGVNGQDRFSRDASSLPAGMYVLGIDNKFTVKILK